MPPARPCDGGPRPSDDVVYPFNIKRFLVRTYRTHAAVDILFIRTDIIIKIPVARTILSGAIGTGFDLDQVADTSV